MNRTFQLLACLVLTASCEADNHPPPADAGAGGADAELSDAALSDGALEAPLEVRGTWESEYGGLVAISDTAWGAERVHGYDNSSNTAYTQNPAGDPWNPDKFNKHVWTEIAEDGFYECTVDFGLDTLADAMASTATADSSDPSTSGCGGFPWTRLRLAIEIYGKWATNFQTTEIITSSTWDNFGEAPILEFDNVQNVAITQNPADAAFDPGKYNRIVWTEPTDQTFYTCTVDFGLDTLAEAQNSSATADATDPATSGCGGFSWTQMVPAIEIHGSWKDSATADVSIDSFSWNGAPIISYDNRSNTAVVQNPADAATDAGKFNKVQWTDPAFDGFYLCWIDTGLESAEAAELSLLTADPSDPATGGCGDGPWSKLGSP